MSLKRAGWSPSETDEWSWPKFYLRARLAEEAEMCQALLTSMAVWNPKEVQANVKIIQARLHGEKVAGDGEWEPMTAERLMQQMEKAEQDG